MTPEMYEENLARANDIINAKNKISDMERHLVQLRKKTKVFNKFFKGRVPNFMVSKNDQKRWTDCTYCYLITLEFLNFLHRLSYTLLIFTFIVLDGKINHVQNSNTKKRRSSKSKNL